MYIVFKCRTISDQLNIYPGPVGQIGKQRSTISIPESQILKNVLQIYNSTIIMTGSYLPDFVITISVPKLWNCSQRSLQSSSTLGSSWTWSSGGSNDLTGRMGCGGSNTSPMNGDRTVCCSLGRIDAVRPG